MPLFSAKMFQFDYIEWRVSIERRTQLAVELENAVGWRRSRAPSERC
jgi:hypothetical protein